LGVLDDLLEQDDLSSNRHPALTVSFVACPDAKPGSTPDQVRGRLLLDTLGAATNSFSAFREGAGTIRRPFSFASHPVARIRSVEPARRRRVEGRSPKAPVASHFYIAAAMHHFRRSNFRHCLVINPAEYPWWLDHHRPAMMASWIGDVPAGSIDDCGRNPAQ
jgi:hypothetical protein